MSLVYQRSSVNYLPPVCRRLILLFLLSTLVALPVWAQKWNRYGPGTRSQSTAIYDSSTNQMIMFGGQHAPTAIDFDDAWTLKNAITSSPQLNNQEWEYVNASNKPIARFGHTAVYNPTSNRMIVFGGGTGFPGPCVNEVWVLMNPNSVGGSPAWSQLAPTGSLPPAREGHVAVYNSRTNTMVVFGGTDCNGNYFNDLWILNNADGSTGTPSWTHAMPTTSPSARSQSTATYDSVNNIMTLFGGAAGSTAFNDVWTLSSSQGAPTWKQLAPTGTAPVARSGHSAVYDSTNNRMIVYGGNNSAKTTLNDLWILTNANGKGATPAWTKMTATAPSPFRSSHTAIYDSVSNQMLVFGGTTQIPKTFTDDHVMVLTHANGL